MIWEARGKALLGFISDKRERKLGIVRMDYRVLAGRVAHVQRKQCWSHGQRLYREESWGGLRNPEFRCCDH